MWSVDEAVVEILGMADWWAGAVETVLQQFQLTGEWSASDHHRIMSNTLIFKNLGEFMPRVDLFFKVQAILWLADLLGWASNFIF